MEHLCRFFTARRDEGPPRHHRQKVAVADIALPARGKHDSAWHGFLTTVLNGWPHESGLWQHRMLKDPVATHHRERRNRVQHVIGARSRR